MSRGRWVSYLNFILLILLTCFQTQIKTFIYILCLFYLHFLPPSFSLILFIFIILFINIYVYIHIHFYSHCNLHLFIILFASFFIFYFRQCLIHFWLHFQVCLKQMIEKCNWQDVFLKDWPFIFKHFPSRRINTVKTMTALFLLRACFDYSLFSCLYLILFYNKFF